MSGGIARALPSTRRGWVVVRLALLTGLMGGCASTGHEIAGDARGVVASLPGTFLDGRTGRPVEDADVVARLRGVRVVFAAEHHGQADNHRMQAALAVLLTRTHAPGAVAAVVEWLPRSAQPSLEGWMQGLEEGAALRTKTAWDEVWGHTFDAYLPFLEILRASGTPVIAGNAEPLLARSVARGEPLEPARAALLPPLNSGNSTHRAWFEAQMSSMGGHGHHGHALGPERLERLYRAQLVWDETMAASVDAALADGYAAVVVCAGVGHITHGHGIPARIGGARWLTVQPVASAEEAVALAVDAPYPERVADLFWVP